MNLAPFADPDQTCSPDDLRAYASVEPDHRSAWAPARSESEYAAGNHQVDLVADGSDALVGEAEQIAEQLS